MLATKPKNSLLFTPGHKFSRLWLPARYKAAYGGRGSAKSWTFAEALVRIADACRVDVLCGREYQTSIKTSVHKLLAEQIERWGFGRRYIVTDQRIVHRHTRSEFYFIGVGRSIQEAKSLESMDILWIEEAQTATAETWDVITKTIRKRGSEIWATFNPNKDDDPTYERLVVNPPPRSIIFKINYDENPFFTPELEEERQYDLSLIESASTDNARLQAQANYDHTWLGMPTRRIGASILKRWEIKDFEVPEAVRWFHGADWGFANDPTALIRFFVHNDCLYIDAESYGHGVEIDETPQLFDAIDTARTWPIKADNSRPETISYMARQGFNIEPADKWPGSVEDGIAHLNGFKRIYIRPRCVHIAEEARKYSYKVDKKTEEVLPIIVDADNHGWDAVRYGLDQYIQNRGGLGIWKKLAG